MYRHNYFHLEKKGKLAAGYDADLTIFDLFNGEKTLTDSNGFYAYCEGIDQTSENDCWRHRF